MIIMTTIKIGHNSKSRHVEKKNNNNGTNKSVNMKIIILIASNNNHNKFFNSRKNDNENSISSNNNNYTNNNNLKDGQYDRLEKKQTLIRTKNWPGIYAEKYILLKVTRKTIYSNVQKKKINNSGIYNIYHGPISPEWRDGRWSSLL